MRVGFIGAGGITRPYRQALRTSDGVVIAAVQDVDSVRATAVADEEGAAAFDDHRKMLDATQLDAVFICIPPFAHKQQVAECAARGLHVFVAKPVALDLETARRTIAALDQAGVIHQAGYMWRSADAVRHAKALIGGRALTMAAGQVLVGVPPTPWWGVRAKSGGQVLEQSTHLVDLLRYYLGEVVEVQAMGHAGAQPELTDFEDSTVGNLRFASGAVASLASTSTGGLGRYSLVLAGRDLCLEVAAGANQVSGRIDGEAVSYTGEAKGMAEQVTTFLTACRTGDQSLVPSSYPDAARTLAATVAFNEALATGQTVRVHPV
ncbi:MAG: Gfo/Idh/MocA family oxidoreductase [Gammaproteobacteria bacterium]|nr:Gfo/Idh/MocA family oxidoreductase [Gammaproteobacteria bacterium]